MKNLVLLFIFIPSIAQAQYFEPFSTQDWILQGVFTGLVTVDYFQTSESFSHDPPTHYEANPTFSKNPDQGEINLKIGAGLIAHICISKTLYGKYRTAWQLITSVIEGWVVVSNELTVTVSVGF